MGKGYIRLIVAILLILGLILILNSKATATEPYVEKTNKNCTECHRDKYYPANDFFKAETKTKWHYNWWLFSLFFFVFCAGILGKVYIWNLGHGPILHRERIEWTINKEKIIHIEKIEWKRFLDFLFFELILQRKIFKESLLRWYIYLSESLGFMILFLVFLVLVFTRFVFKIDFFITGIGGLILDFLLDFIGLIILSGTIVSFIRRSIKRPNMITERGDIVAVLFLFFIVLTGFFLEAFRLAVLPVSFESYFSFVGLGIASVIRHFDMPWTDIHFYTWIFHATIVFLFLVYIPFSKFIHFMACPIATLAISSDPQG